MPAGSRRWIAAIAKQYMDVLFEQPRRAEKRRAVRFARCESDRRVRCLAFLVTFWALRRRSGANSEAGREAAEGRMPGVKKSNHRDGGNAKRNGTPDDAPSGPSALQVRVRVTGFFDRTSLSCRKTGRIHAATLRAFLHPPAASYGDPEGQEPHQEPRNAQRRLTAVGLL